MNDPLLLEKHLADGLTDAETAELEAAVGGEPAAARRLVAAARMDERLAARLGPGRSELACLAGLKRGRTPLAWVARWYRPLAVAAAVVLLLGLAAAVGGWIRSIASSPTEAVTGTLPAKARPFVPAPVVVLPARAADPLRVEKETPAMASLRRFLSNYYLTDLKLEAGRPLEEALQRLLQRARELNHLKNPMVERLSVELAAAEPGDDRPDTAVALPLKNVSLMDGLNWMAALNRSEVFLREPGVITFRPWERDENETLVTEVVRVRPDLLTRPVATDGQNPANAEPGSSGAGADSFIERTETPAAPRLTPIELFQSWGIAFSGQASAAYDEATAAMTIRQTESTLRLITVLLAVESSRQPAMVSITSKIFEYAQAPPIRDELLTEKQFQVWLRDQNQTQGVKLLTTPQVTTRSGQRAMVEVGGEVGRPGAEEMNRTDAEIDWQGLRIPLEPIFEGEVVKVVGAVELRLPVDRQPGQWLVPRDVPPGDLVTTATDFEAIVPPGQTAVFSVSESPEGPHFAMTVTVATIDPSGQRVGAPEGEPDQVRFPQPESGGRRAGP